MKKYMTLLLSFMLGFCISLFAQRSPSETGSFGNYFKFQPRLKIGAGQTFTALPMRFDDVNIYLNQQNTDTFSGLKNDFLKTNWGLYGGANFDFYFHPNFGLGLDFDYFHNKLEFTVPAALRAFVDQYPIMNLVESNRKNQNFIFLGIGPSFKFLAGNKFDIDFNIRGGLSHLQMGSLNVSIDTLPLRLNRKEVMIYDFSKPKNAFGIKSGLYFNYWFTPAIGLTLGVDFIHSFVSAETINDDAEYVLQYKDPSNFLVEGNLDPDAYFGTKLPVPLDNYPAKSFNINYLAVSAGVVFGFIKTSGPEPKDIIVMVRDSLKKKPLPGVNVFLTDTKGSKIQTLQTGADGKVKFENVLPGDYVLAGEKAGLLASKAYIELKEFSKLKKTIYRELFMANPDFILNGLVVECDFTNKTIGKVDIQLTNKKTGKIEKAVSDKNGKFTFMLEPNTDYSVVGTMSGHYSGTKDITTKGLDRSKTQYINLVLCVSPLEVGKTIVLNNIYYDFDKCDIRKDAAVELDRLVELMKKYPNMEIELSSHTDQRGAESYNQQLSQCRAESAVNYIVSKGISKTRIKAVGYGETKLLQDCTKVQGCPVSSEGDCPCHQNNRRTEIKILKM